MAGLFEAEKADREYIIEKLCGYLGQCNFSLRTCTTCGDIDHRDEFRECHLGSDIWCCEECLSNANFEGLKICKNCPEPVENEDNNYIVHIGEISISELDDNILKDKKDKENIAVEIGRAKIAEKWNIDESGSLISSLTKLHIKEAEEGKELDKATNLPTMENEKDKTKKKESYYAKEIDPHIIIEHLEDLLFHLKAPITTCDLCGWVDIGEPFLECCSGSYVRCCKKCIENAEKENATLCRNYCPYFNNSDDDIDESFSSNCSKDVKNNIEIKENSTFVRDMIEKNSAETPPSFLRDNQEDPTLIVCKGDNLPSPLELDISEGITKGDNEEILLTPVKKIKVVRLNSSNSNISPKEEIYF